MLAAISCLIQPTRSRNRTRNFLTFRKHLKGVPLFTLEGSYDGRFAVPDTTYQVRLDRDQLLWQKERALNLLLERLPQQFDRVAWLDGDILLLDDGWAEKTEALLDRFPVIQPFSKVHYLDPDHQIHCTLHSCAARLSEGDVSGFPGASGFAWAARREVLEEGFYDRHIVGGGDALMLSAWGGGSPHPVVDRITPSNREDWRQWAVQAYEKVQGRFGFLQGEIIHLYHGRLGHRQYISRHEPLLAHHFDPRSDIRLAPNGFWRFATEKREMQAGIRRYFAQRHEDSD